MFSKGEKYNSSLVVQVLTRLLIDQSVEAAGGYAPGRLHVQRNGEDVTGTND